MKIPKEIKDKVGIGNTKGKMCSILGCDKGAIRSLPEKEYEGCVLKAKLKYYKSKTKRIFLCNKHFTMIKRKKGKDKIKSKKGFLNNTIKPYKTKW